MGTDDAGQSSVLASVHPVLDPSMQTCHSIELKNLDLTNKKSGSGGKNRDHGPIGYKKK